MSNSADAIEADAFKWGPSFWLAHGRVVKESVSKSRACSAMSVSLKPALNAKDFRKQVSVFSWKHSHPLLFAANEQCVHFVGFG